MRKLGIMTSPHHSRCCASTMPEVDMVPEARKTVRIDRLMLSS